MSDGFLSEQLDFGAHSGREPGVCVFQELTFGKELRVLRLRKDRKQECELWQLKEAILSDTAVFVHWLSHNCKVDGRVLEVAVILLVPVAEHQHFQHFDVFGPLFGCRQGLE
jgi:hypothetical protein